MSLACLLSFFLMPFLVPLQAEFRLQESGQEEPGQEEPGQEEPGPEEPGQEEPAGEEEKPGEENGEGEKEGEEEPEGEEPPEVPVVDRIDDRPSPLELDTKSPRFVAKDLPAFVVVRPSGGKGSSRNPPVRKKGAAAIDGSRWGFVDLSLRKKREEGRWDRHIAALEKMARDEKATEERRESARKDAVFHKAQKTKWLKSLEKIRCRVELVGNHHLWLQIRQQDPPRGMSEKMIRDNLRSNLESSGISIQSERPEIWQGKRIPGYTFLLESKSEEVESLIRATYFIVPKGKIGTSIVYFECFAPKSQRTEQVERELEAFIRGSQFTS